MALDILSDQKAICPGPRVFDCPVTKLRNLRLRFNRKHKLQDWWFHDLRRTARTLMSVTGTPDRVAELVLGHVQRGVEMVYNRHTYFDEKSEALEKLAEKFAEIVSQRKAA
jgi:integrase